MDESDIFHCLEFVHRHRLELAVRSGGHDVLAASTCEGGIVIDTSLMKAMDLTRRTSVTFGAGCLAGEANDYLQRSNLAVPFGDADSVGIAGLTLGGGLGWLLGKYGAACDNLISARLVLADGRALTVSEEQHPDLFWAIRGGGGNFGIVTQLQYQTHPVGQVFGGKIICRASDLRDFLRFFADFQRRAPDELTVELSVSGGDERILVLTVCYSGPRSSAESILAPLLARAETTFNDLSWRAYAEINQSSKAAASLLSAHAAKLSQPKDSELGIFWQGGSIADLSDSVIGVLVSQIEAARGGWSFGLGHHMHGEVTRGSKKASALSRVAGSYCYHFDSWWLDPVESARQMTWVRTSMNALAPHSIPTYVNYLSDNRESAVRNAYGATFPRLLELKHRYDPQNFFHRNRNIR